MAKDTAWLTSAPYAHRGLHDGNHAVPENSLSAAAHAIASGFAIECDLQLARDGVPLVFHDDDLRRLTGREGDIRHLASEEAVRLSLSETAETIPTFASLLRKIGGKVPLLVELKGRSLSADHGFVEAVAREIAGYGGPLALMSFDHHLVKDCREIVRGRPVGLTAEGNTAADYRRHRLVAEDGLDFVSYDHTQLGNPFLNEMRDRDRPILCWTIRSAEDATRALADCDQITFEGFVPTT